MPRWLNFSAYQCHQFGLPAEGVIAEARSCPNCQDLTLRWYRSKGTYRPETAYIYVWCSKCQRYWSQTYWEPAWTLVDPLAHLSQSESLELESDLGRFFATLDDLWERGELPQVPR